MSTDATDHTTNSSNVTIAAEEHITPFTNDTYISVTSSTVTHTDTYHLLNSTTLSYSSTAISPTQKMASDDMRNESTTHILNPDNVFSIMPEESSTLGNIAETQNPATKQKTKHGTVAEGNTYNISHVIDDCMKMIVLFLLPTGLKPFKFKGDKHLCNQQ